MPVICICLYPYPPLVPYFLTSYALCNCSDTTDGSQCLMNTTVYTLHFIWCDPSPVDAADFKMHLKRWQFELRQCGGQFQFHCCFCLPPRCGGVGASPIRPAFPCGDFLGRQKSIAFIHFRTMMMMTACVCLVKKWQDIQSEFWPTGA